MWNARQKTSLAAWACQGNSLRTFAGAFSMTCEPVRLRLTTEGERLHCGVCGSVLSGATAGFPCPRCHGSLGPWKDAEIAIHRTVRRIRSKEIIPVVAGEHTAQ